ncbi:MAG: hypothetical protein LC135_12525 [Phycisphaerae bacterium]|nr:hypothetical protein [Phycisphaerae bacterium]MCZ2400677.1 hypothetical protein [Phycisphaerae bacterium]
MIARIAGRLVELTPGGSACIETGGGLTYEVLVPSAAVAALTLQLGQVVALSTLQYFEGNIASGNLVPRLLGFLTPADRAFFQEFTKVRGISLRRGLRAMSLPAAQLAAAIESGDERLLSSLPEIGKKTAAQIVADLRGKLGEFAGAAAGGPTPVAAEWTGVRRVALEILVQWGDRRADAQRWIAAALEEVPDLREPEEIVRAAYRVKNRVG